MFGMGYVKNSYLKYKNIQCKNKMFVMGFLSLFTLRQSTTTW